MLAPNRTPPRLDLEDRRRPTRIRDALHQLRRWAPPQHRRRLLLEMALLSQIGQSWAYSQSIRPTRRRSTPRSATPRATFVQPIWQGALTAANTAIPQVRHALHRRDRTRHRASRPEHDVRSDKVPGRPADNGRRSHLATVQHGSPGTRDQHARSRPSRHHALRRHHGAGVVGSVSAKPNGLTHTPVLERPFDERGSIAVNLPVVTVFATVRAGLWVSV